MLDNDYVDCLEYNNLEAEGNGKELEFVGDVIYDENDSCSKHLVFNHEGNKFIYMSYDIFTSSFRCK